MDKQPLVQKSQEELKGETQLKSVSVMVLIVIAVIALLLVIVYIFYTRPTDVDSARVMESVTSWSSGWLFLVLLLALLTLLGAVVMYCLSRGHKATDPALAKLDAAGLAELVKRSCKIPVVSFLGVCGFGCIAISRFFGLTADSPKETGYYTFGIAFLIATVALGAYLSWVAVDRVTSLLAGASVVFSVALMAMAFA